MLQNGRLLGYVTESEEDVVVCMALKNKILSIQYVHSNIECLIHRVLGKNFYKWENINIKHTVTVLFLL